MLAIHKDSSSSASSQTRLDAIPWNPKVRQQRTFGDWVIDIFLGLLVTAVVVVVLYPLWFVVIASFSNPSFVATGQVTLLPKGVSIVGYKQLFGNSRIWVGYGNTILYSSLGTLLNMAVTLPAAFALSRYDFVGRRVIMFLFTFTMFFAGGMIPNYLLFKQMKLLNSMWVFILPAAVNVYNLIIARSFFETSIPEELHDASQMDGLTDFGYFFRIVLPLSAAIIAVIGLYYFVGHWNDFFTGLIYIRDGSKLPLQNVLRSILLSSQEVTHGVSSGGRSAVELQKFADQIKYGVIIVSTLPLLVVYPFLQKYFNKGVMIGAVKG